MATSRPTVAISESQTTRLSASPAQAALMSAMSTTETAAGDTGIELMKKESSVVALRPEIGQVKNVPTKEHLLAAATLAEAFEYDDVARYIVDVPDNAHWSIEKKWNLHSTIMGYITYAHCMRTLTTAAGPASDPYGSVALWMYPNKTIESLPVMLSSGLWRLSYKLTSQGRKRGFREFFPLLARTKNEVLGARSKDCYYLVYIGTKPACRGMGLAKRLIQEASAKADKEGKVMYLESSNERNLKLYRSLGFEVRKRVWLTSPNPEGKKIPMDIMVREPGGLLSMAAVDSGISMSTQSTQERASDDRLADSAKSLHLASIPEADKLAEQLRLVQLSNSIEGAECTKADKTIRTDESCEKLENAEVRKVM